MMEKVSHITWVGILAVLMGGGGLLGSGSDKPDVAPIGRLAIAVRPAQ